MPVGTDAILLSAWTRVGGHERILDVGTGTGIMAMILALRSPHSEIEAMDNSEPAVALARENVQNSPFASRINVELADWTQVDKTEKKPFDLIICNPPFFKDSLEPLTDGRKKWRHVKGLGWESLLKRGRQILAENGRINMVCPYREIEEVERTVSAVGLILTRYCRVLPRKGKSSHRIMIEASRKTTTSSRESSQLTIRDRNGQYHSDYLQLAGDLYQSPIDKKRP